MKIKSDITELSDEEILEVQKKLQSDNDEEVIAAKQKLWDAYQTLIKLTARSIPPYMVDDWISYACTEILFHNRTILDFDPSKVKTKKMSSYLRVCLTNRRNTFLKENFYKNKDYDIDDFLNIKEMAYNSKIFDQYDKVDKDKKEDQLLKKIEKIVNEFPEELRDALNIIVWGYGYGNEFLEKKFAMMKKWGWRKKSKMYKRYYQALSIIREKLGINLYENKLKQCSKCGKWKVIDEFYPRRELADGYRSECIECLLKIKHQREANQDPKERGKYIKTYAKEYFKQYKNKERRNEYMRNYTKNKRRKK